MAALISLKTDLKSLKFGKDTQGGGNSGQPYVKIGIPENGSAIERIVQESTQFSSDFPLRGGLYSTRAAAEDAIRIRKFLTDFPKGSEFTYKQVGLQKSNPLIETGRNGGRINTRTYNLNSNLLFSTLTAGSGIHYPRAGSTPLTLLDDNSKYFSIVGKKPTKDNRLVNLYNSKILNLSEDVNFDLLGISPNKFEIMNYIGGPNSLYGDGETVLFRSTNFDGSIIDTNNPNKKSYFKLSDPLNVKVLGASNFLDTIVPIEELNYKKGIYEISGSVVNEITKNNQTTNTFQTSFNTIPYDKIVKEPQYVIGTNLNDFRTKVNSPDLVFSRDYSQPNIDISTRVGIGSPGARPVFRRKNINDVFKEGQDKVNLIPLVYKNFNSPPEEEENARDLIKFNFETIDNNNPDFTYRTHFRAFLSGFSDGVNSNWESKKYAGRGEEMYNYQGFNRDISFSFVVSAQSKQEMKPLWQKLQYLTSTLYPDYSPDNGFMRGNIHRLTIGEYLYRTPGILKSLTFSVEENYPWEIKIDQPENGFDNDMMELPQIIKVNARFSPILDTLARTITLNDTNIPSLITNNVGRNNFINNFEIKQ